MAWRRPGNKPLSEPMMVSLLTHICVIQPQWDNSLAPGRSECHSKNIIFNLVLLIGSFRSSHNNALRWMSQDLTDDKSTLVQVMAWCLQETNLYLSQCWLSSLSPYGAARPQQVKSFPCTNLAPILQMIFPDALSWIKTFVFWLKFHKSLFLKVQLSISQH